MQISEGKKTLLDLCFEGKATEEEAVKAWESLYSEYIQEFGVSDEYKHFIRKKALLCDLYKKLYVNGEIWQHAVITVTKMEIETLEMNLQNSSSDFNEILGKLAKKMGFAINPIKTTIREFYSYIKS